MNLDKQINKLVLALNINSKKKNYSYIIDYKYSNQRKALIPKFKLTTWKKTIDYNKDSGEKTYSKRLDFQEFQSKIDFLKHLSELINDG